VTVVEHRVDLLTPVHERLVILTALVDPTLFNGRGSARITLSRAARITLSAAALLGVTMLRS
jgi:hypothetical protein